MTRTQIIGLAAIVFALQIAVAQTARAQCCSGHGNYNCDDPGYLVCDTVGIPPVILCQGAGNNDLFQAYTDSSGEPCVFGHINLTDFCCDSSDLGGTMHKLQVLGAAGDDQINAYYNMARWEHDTALYGQGGGDQIYGSNDTTYSDFISGGTDADSLYGQKGDDNLIGGADDDVLNGGDEDDYLTGGTGADTLRGDADDDILCAVDGSNDDTSDGGSGTDDCYIDGSPENGVNCTNNESACP